MKHHDIQIGDVSPYHVGLIQPESKTSTTNPSILSWLISCCAHTTSWQKLLRHRLNPGGRNNMLYNGRKSKDLLQHGELLIFCCGMRDEVEYVLIRAYSNTRLPLDHRDQAKTHISTPTTSRERGTPGREVSFCPVGTQPRCTLLVGD